MKKIKVTIISTLTVLLISTLSFAQSPEKMSYQAVIRDANNALVTNQQIGMQISILQSSASGTAVYTETHDATTNANGLVTVEIGAGDIVSGDFSTIDWSADTYFIKTETDPTGGTNYTITGVSQLLSVPYALHAKTAETVTGEITETDPIFTSSEAANITATDITNLENLSGVNTGDQDLSTLATKTALGDSTAQVRSEIPDVSEFLTSETDPTFTSSQAANIDATDITNLGNLSGTNTGDQDLSTLATKTALGDSTAQVRSEIPDVSGFLSAETDPTFTSSQAANIDVTDITNLGNLSGTNTGDQDLSTLATKTALGDSTAQVRSEIPDVSGFLTSETDPTFTSSQAANIDVTDITNLGNLSGTNTGDQDLSTLATKTALGDSTAQVRSEIPDVSGFLTSETDPIYGASQAASITATDITNLGNLSGVNTGDQDLSTLATKTALGDSTAQVRSEIPDVSSFLTTETDPLYSASQAASITATDITNLGNLSGVNTGDQDLSTLATKTALGDSTAQVRSEIPDVSEFLTSETDPTFTSSQAANIDAGDITNLGNLSGVNTGDQDLSTLATKTALGDSTAQVRSEIPDVSGFLTSYTETDPTFTSSQAANITASDITNLSNLSGVNTGDQDLSTLATKTALGDSTAHVRSEIPDVSGIANNEQAIQDTAAQIRADIPEIPAGTQTGDMQYWDGSEWITVSAGTTGQLLSVNASGVPEWQNPSALKTAYTTQPDINTNGVVFNGVVNANGYTTSVIFEYGTTTGYGNTIVATTTLSGTTAETVVSSTISNLTLGTVYHVRMVVENVFGTFYSNDLQFTNLYYGASYAGGLVFDFDDSGNGVVAATEDQINGFPDWETAFSNCSSYSVDSYDDWYLPSITELTLMAKNLHSKGFGSFTDYLYWSSTELNDEEAYGMFFINWGGNLYWRQEEPMKIHNGSARAVRAF